MKLQNIALLLLSAFFLNGCASGYQVINPPAIHYLSTSNDKSVTIEYKYNLLNKKYAKKESNNNIRVIAVKIVNNSSRDLIFGSDIKLNYGNGNEVSLVENDKVFKSLRQQTGFYLFYLLLTPATFSTTSNGVQTSSFPIGYGLGPGLTAINMLVGGTANAQFKDELTKYNIYGTTIKAGSTVYGLVGINSNAYENISVKVK